MTTKILAVNCNTDTAMTAAIAAIGQAAASPGTTVVGVTPAWGPASAEGYVESLVTATAVMDAVARRTDAFDAVVMAGFGEHGREGMRQLITQPVVDITEAAVFTACLLGHRVGVVTTVASALAGIHDSITTMGMAGRCCSVRAADVHVSSIGDDVARTADALEGTGRAVLADGADVLVLGCAGFAGLDAELERRLGVPVVDGVAAAVRWAESLVALGKRTSTAGPYAPRDREKVWSGPPLGALRLLT
ncbi:aspartate/glutamate racemase family protein [Microbacterium sp. PM5]|uniref:aspartate/glutamate racemase family protein n=1 Tax=Microbacterium sp. PM5 TaxID=2014534 RepID=UPI000DD11110|nr:aspartate/glutamate racemase family protein [Microbacterium sp. PM5]AXA96225.1 Asp/Glu/hydantoin racemase [Microbacterium sp. PM5]MDC7804594.1 aspartate/glutamate racemase family protein [Sphingomonas sp. BLCC-B65]